MLTNIIFTNLIKDLLSVLITAVIIAAFLILMAFLISFTVILIRGIILSLFASFKVKKIDDLATEEENKELSK